MVTVSYIKCAALMAILAGLCADMPAQDHSAEQEQVELREVPRSDSHPLNVCTLSRYAKRYDGRKVVVTGFVRADRHITGIQSDGCSHLVVIRYDRRSAPPKFVNGVEDKRLNLNPRRFRVIIEGVFKRQIKAPFGTVSRIDVARVLEFGFDPDESVFRSAPSGVTESKQ